MSYTNRPKVFRIEDMVINYTPIVYNPDTDFTKVSNVLLVDTDVQDYNKFVEGCNVCTFPIVFSRSSNKEEIADLLTSKLPTIYRIAIVANNSNLDNKKKPFFNYKPYFLESDLLQGVTNYSENLQFLIDIIKAHNVKNIDYLACYSLNYDSWKRYYELLTKETGVTVGASSNATGSLKYGGDWIMESTGVDLETIYFSEGISSYQGTLDTTTLNMSCKLYMNGGNVAYSTNNGITKTNIVWPCKLKGNIKVTLVQNLTFGAVNCYFIINNSNYVTLEGGNHTITIKSVKAYTGLVQSLSKDTFVKNLGVLTNGNSSLMVASGWVGCGDVLQNFNFNGTVNNCYSTGYIRGGGIVGSYAGGKNGRCTIKNCYSSGSISEFGSGGIVGFDAGQDGICTINNCYSTGIIGGETSGGIAGFFAGRRGICNISNCYSTGTISRTDSGGIAGVFAGGYGGICNISNCYSTGSIRGIESGGIAGSYAGYDGNCNISNCYSTGTISGIQSGGIVGSYAGSRDSNTRGNCDINNCYSTGSISGLGSGGIAGSNSSMDNGKCTITNCYSTGIFNTNNSIGGIFGTNTGSNSKINNCYVAGSSATSSIVYRPSPSNAIILNSSYSNGWNDNIASSPTENGFNGLLNPPSGSSWKPIHTDRPWKLGVFLLDANPSYNIGTLIYTNTYPISSYSKALTVKLINNGNTYGSETVTLTQKSVTLNNISSINKDLTTYLVLYSGDTLVDYVDKFVISNIPIIRVTKVKLNSTAINITTKTTYRLTATVSPSNATDKRVTWFSSNTKIATVNTSGLVTAVGQGKATITVTTVDGSYRATSSIIVVQPVTSVKLNLTSSNISVNSSKRLIATILPANATDKRVIWSSSNTKVATVDSSGLVKAKNIAGVATITVKTFSGSYKATATIKVTRIGKDILLATNSSNNSTVEFSIDADYNTLLTFVRKNTLRVGCFSDKSVTIGELWLNVDTALEAYSLALIDQIVAKTDISIDDIEILNISSGSIVNEISIPTEYVAGLQYVVQSGNFEITLDGVTYKAIPSSFKIIDNICFYKGTMILTPSGYRAVETINSGDVVKTAQGHIVKVRKVTSFIGTTEKCPLYVLHKDSLSTNMPLTDLYMSEGHAYRHNGQWCHMKCSSVAMKLDLDDIEYYNIVLDNYLENTLVANGVEVESLFNMKGLEMTWNCGTDNCKPVIATV